MTPVIKSICAVRAEGQIENAGSWCARIRLSDGKELFCGIGAGYSLAQAEMLISNCGQRVGQPFDADCVPPWSALPEGLKIRAT